MTFLCPCYTDLLLPLIHSELGLDCDNSRINKQIPPTYSPNSGPNLIFYCNVRSIVQKRHLIPHYIGMYHPFVIAMSETWLDEDVPSSLICPEGFTVHRRDRSYCRGGGVIILVRDGCISSTLNLGAPESSASVTSPTCDTVACKIDIGDGKSMGVLCVYRPPSCSPDNNSKMMEMIANFLRYNFDYNVIVGDFNFPDINWSVNASTLQGSTFLDFCQENFLLQHVSEPTRRASRAILDLIFTTEGTRVSDLEVNEEFGSSDHSIITFNVNPRVVCSKKNRLRRDLRKADWDRFKSLLASHDWSSIMSNEDINDSWQSFVNIIHLALDKVAPLRRIPVRNFSSNAKIRTSLRMKRRCFRIFQSDPTPDNSLRYVKSVFLAKNALNEYIAHRESVVITNPDPRVFWSYVNRRLTNRAELTTIKDNDLEITDQEAIANRFNDYFVSVFKDSPSIDLPYDNSTATQYNGVKLSDVDVNVYNVTKILKNLPNKNSVDNDGFSYNILKKGGSFVSRFLSHFFSLTLKQSQIPDAWKKAIVTPIYKNGSKTSVRNYRPISITSCCSRILERIVNGKIIQHLVLNNVLNDTQHGFLPGKSTDTILLKFYDYVTENVDKGLAVDAVFFDYSKAFDSVPHSVLLSRLEASGVAGSLLTWVKNFLSDRQQKVKVGDAYSTWLPVSKGVIQGSVLGPTLFNVFLNNIDESVSHCFILKYADDLRIFLASPKPNSCDLQLNVQKDITSLTKWSEGSGTFNVKKCLAVSFGGSSARREYFIEGNQIPASSSFTDLGVRVTSSLNFQPHIDACVAKSFAKMRIINKVFKNKTSLLPLYKAFVRPLTEYSCLIWSPYTQKGKNKVESVQKRICRMIPSLRRLCYRDQLMSSGLMSMEARRLRYQLMTIFKMCKGLSVLQLEDLFDRAISKRTRGHSHSLISKHCRTNYRLNFFTVSSVKHWNMLSEDEVDVSTLTQFKSSLNGFFARQGIW